MYLVISNEITYRITFDKNNIVHVTDKDCKSTKALNGYRLYKFTKDGGMVSHANLLTGITKLCEWKHGIAIKNNNNKFLPIRESGQSKCKTKRKKQC
jgi:hypothetical protein